MNMRRIFVGLAVLVLVSLCEARRASAGVVPYSNQSSFESQGTITKTSNFDDLATGATVAVPFPRGGVTYTGVNYNIDGPGAYGGVLDSVRQALFNAQFGDLTGNIDNSPTSYTMFGFKTGYVTLDVVPLENVMLTTNMGTYQISGLTVPRAGTSLGFVGFATDTPGEYFTGFAISTTPRNPSAPDAPVMTDVELGNITAAVPEPASLTLLGVGLMSIVGFGWQRRRQFAAA